jgi:hypothetical protein
MAPPIPAPTQVITISDHPNTPAIRTWLCSCSLSEGGDAMKRVSARHLVGAFALAGLVALTAPGAASPHRLTPGPSVDIQQVASLAPDGRSLTVAVLASCPERWTVVEASVAVSQPQGSGRASFPLTCIGSVRGFSVPVSASTGVFDLSDAHVAARVVIQRGRTQQVQDEQAVDVQPGVVVELADSARIIDGGAAVVISVTVACPPPGVGLQSSLNVSQSGLVLGGGSYTPICDGSRHTFTVTARAIRGVYQPGIAQAVTFANLDYNGEAVYGIDEDGALELIP